MKKAFLLTLFILLAGRMLALTSPQEQAPPKSFLKGDVLELDLRDPGTLEKFLAPGDEKRVRCIRLSGVINGDDMRTLKRICDRSSAYDETGKSVSNYLDLELDRVRIVGGGSSYSNRTEHDVIGRDMFRSFDCLRSVSLPRMIKRIDNNAFTGCGKLEEVRFMRCDLRSIGDEVFSGCSSLMRINLPDGIESLGNRCFYNCTNLRRLDLPASIRSIGREAFYNVPLTSIQLPYNLTDMGSNALNGTKLTTVLLPAGLKMENDQIGNIQTLKEFQVERGNQNYTTEDGVLYDITGNILLCCPSGKSGAFNVPSGVQTIKNNAFWQCRNLSAISFPTSLGVIGSNSFNNCTSLKSVSIPVTVKAIGESAFASCSNLTTADVQATISSLPDRMFQDCSSLKQVKLPNGLSKIGSNAFENCKSLEMINGANALTSIGKEAFKKCGLTEVVLPAGMAEIGENAYRDCKQLKSITFGPGLKSIPKELMRGCDNLTSVLLPESLTSIGENAFRDCKSLPKINLPNTITSIDNNAFRGTSITQLLIPASIQTIGDKIVEKCKMLNITCMAVNPPALKKISEKKTPLFVPAQSVEAYKNAKPWKDFKNILPIE